MNYPTRIPGHHVSHLGEFSCYCFRVRSPTSADPRTGRSLSLPEIVCELHGTYGLGFALITQVLDDRTPAERNSPEWHQATADTVEEWANGQVGDGDPRIYGENLSQLLAVVDALSPANQRLNGDDLARALTQKLGRDYSRDRNGIHSYMSLVDVMRSGMSRTAQQIATRMHIDRIEGRRSTH